MTTTQEVDRVARPASRTIWFVGGAILFGHLLVDMYGAMGPSILGVLEIHCHLKPSETAWLLGIGAFSGGISQPVCAWLSDRYNWRGFGGLGLMLAAFFLCLVGMATSFGSLLPIYILGMVGLGMFHPIAAASMGGLSELRHSSNISLFFVVGMLGGVIGATVTPRLITGTAGFSAMYWAIAPGFVVAWVLHQAIHRLPHRQASHRTSPLVLDKIRARWIIVGFLYIASVLRFSVNLALAYLYVRWVQDATGASHPDWTLSEIARYSVPMVGNLNACMIVGMALGGIGAGFFVRRGGERWPMVLCPIVFAPAVALFPHATLAWSYILSVLVGIGFGAMIPVSIALSQRLLPHRTSLASGLMMGGSWAIAMVGPPLAEFGVQHLGIGWSFYLTASVLCLAGLVVIPLHVFSRDLF